MTTRKMRKIRLGFHIRRDGELGDVFHGDTADAAVTRVIPVVVVGRHYGTDAMIAVGSVHVSRGMPEQAGHTYCEYEK